MAEPIRVQPVGVENREHHVQPASVLKFESRNDTRPAHLVAADAVSSTFVYSYRKVRNGARFVTSGVSTRLRYMASERPTRIILGVAIASFAAGVALRLWRSRYE